MSEHDRDGSWPIGAFLLGFLTGVLVCLGAGGVFVAFQARTMAMAAEEARAIAEMERHRALAAAHEAAEQRARAEEILRKQRAEKK